MSAARETGQVGIRRVSKDKWSYQKLLLLADEQEDMIRRYLDRGTMFVLEMDGEAVAECVVTDEGGGVAELKNIAVAPEYQRRGYGRRLVRHVEQICRGKAKTLLVGTGDSPLTIPFYRSCGFTESHRVKNFFTDHYDHPIIEGGVRLTDMVYLRKDLSGTDQI